MTCVGVMPSFCFQISFLEFDLFEVLENTLLLQLVVNYKQVWFYSLNKCLSCIISYVHG
jgi:hypothetical protein